MHMAMHLCAHVYEAAAGLAALFRVNLARSAG
jgi:hypothetical protein